MTKPLVEVSPELGTCNLKAHMIAPLPYKGLLRWLHERTHYCIGWETSVITGTEPSDA